MKLDYHAIGKRLQEARKTKNLTQQALADAMGVSVSYIKNTEGGKKPSLDYLFTVTNLCHVSFDWLLTGFNISKETEKKETTFDTELNLMFDILSTLMISGDADLRGWTKIQFKNAFKEYYELHKSEKNFHA